MNNLVDFLQTERIDYREGGTHSHVTVGWIGIDCPFCGSHGKYHLGINATYLACSCWICGPHRFYDVLIALRVPPDRIREALSIRRKTYERPEKRRGSLELPANLQPLTSAHRRYLIGRGFNPDEISTIWGVGGIAEWPARYSWRLFIPIFLDGEIVSWTTRAIGDTQARYRSAPAKHEAIPAKELLYGADYADLTAIVVEGPTKAWRVGPGAVATLGVQTTSAQVKRLSQFHRRVICFDNDEAGRTRARALAQLLSSIPGDTLTVEIESADDVDEADEEEIIELRRRFLEN